MMTRDLSTQQKVGQLFFIGIDGPEFDGTARDLLDDIAPGGICLFSRNIHEKEQTRRLTDSIRERSPIVPLLSIDQEGGLVDRLRRILPSMPPADKLLTPQHCARAGEIIGYALGLLGLNMNFAPVVDVVDESRRSTSNGLHSRPFGSSREDVVSLAGAFLDAMEGRGILGCLKHFPGLGASQLDSHEDLPHINISEDELEAKDLYPYRQLLSAHAVRPVMVAHAAFPGTNLQEEDQNGKLTPSSLSYNFVEMLLRQRLEFDGLVMTDDLQMGAIIKNYGIGEACVRALAAGVDMLSICSDGEVIRKGHRAVTDAVAQGTISMERLDDSLRRILDVKASLNIPAAFDLSFFETLSGDIASLNQELSSI